MKIKRVFEGMAKEKQFQAGTIGVGAGYGFVCDLALHSPEKNLNIQYYTIQAGFLQRVKFREKDRILFVATEVERIGNTSKKNQVVYRRNPEKVRKLFVFLRSSCCVLSNFV